MNSLKLLAPNAWDAVMSSQPFVQEGKISVEEIQNAAVFLDDRFKEKLGLLEHRRAEGFIEGGEQAGVRRGGFQAAQFQPLAGKVINQGVRFSVLQHPANLRFQDRLFVQLILPSLLEQLVVGHAAPQEVGKPAGQLKIIDGVNGFFISRLRIELDAEQEVR